MKNVLEIKGADFSNCAVPVGTIVPLIDAYKQTDGFYNSANIEIGTTTISSVFTSRNEYHSYLVPLSSNKAYKIKSYDFGTKGNNVVAWAIIANGVILAYTNKINGVPTIQEAEFDVSDYEGATDVLICYADSSKMPVLVEY